LPQLVLGRRVAEKIAPNGDCSKSLNRQVFPNGIDLSVPVLQRSRWALIVDA